MRRVVIVLLGLNARIGKVLDLRLQAELFALPDHHISQFEQGELLGDLIKDPILTGLSWRKYSQFNASDGIAHIDIAAYLLPLAQGILDGATVQGPAGATTSTPATASTGAPASAPPVAVVSP